jgi:hypothetical protein
MTTPRNPTTFGDELDPDPAGSHEESWRLDEDPDDDLDDDWDDDGDDR